MKKDDYIKAFLEGAALAPQGEVIMYLVDMLYEARQTNYRQREHIEYMDDVARENTISVTCRSCERSFEPDCELSEISHEGNYCGRNEFCCP